MTDVCGCAHDVTQHSGACRECNCPSWHEEHEIVDVMINGRWPLRLPDYRAYRPSWPWWEAQRLASMAHHLGDGDTIIDVGAEEGDFPALWASWGCRVVAIEPNPKVWPSIRASFEANDLRPVAWAQCLLSDSCKGEVDVGRDRWPGCAYGPLIAEHGFFSVGQHDSVCPTSTLDALVDRLGVAPTAITVDVEGAEAKVLRGAERTLKEHRPKVWVSIHPEFMADLYGESDADVHALMADAGYRRTYLATDHEQHFFYEPR